MANLNPSKLAIKRHSGMGAGDWSPVLCPLYEARRVTIANSDIVADLYVATDTSDANSVLTIAAGSEKTITFSDNALRGLQINELSFYVKGGGDQPLFTFVR